MQTGAEVALTRPAAPTVADRELMEELRGGDFRALGTLFERHHQTLYNFLFRLVRDRSAAEDLVQEVFVRILKYSHNFRAHSDFLPWMFAVARHAVVDRHRRRPRELPQDPDAPDPAASGPLPIEAREDADRRKALNRALGRLTPDVRETLLLARFSGLKYAEIGEVLGISEGAVKARVHRAMLELRKERRR
jgi:RNA polymerase sigma factor (sigma-70 family)